MEIKPLLIAKVPTPATFLNYYGNGSGIMIEKEPFFLEVKVDFPVGKLVHQLFSDCARQYPERIALIEGDKELYYGELDRITDSLAAGLITNGVKVDDTVGIFIDRSINYIITILSIVKSGGWYVPIDTDIPADRLSFIIVVSENRRLYEHGAILTGLAIVFLLLCVPGGVVSSINNSNSVYQVCSKESGRWLKYVPPGQIQKSHNAIVFGNCTAWDLKKLTDFIKKQFPDDNIFIPLDQTSGLPVHGKIILCGKSCQQAKRFREYEQYWLLPEGLPANNFPPGLKKIYLSRYDESGYNRLWKSQAAQITILIEETD